jgi:ABC-2 type transport system ATP-binding protein
MKVIDRSELDAAKEKYEVISNRLFSGRTIIHVHSESDPGDGFTRVEGGLADVYFSTLSQSRRAA